MVKILLVGPGKTSLSGLETAFEARDEVELLRAYTGKSALEIVSDDAVDLVITDEDLGDMPGLEFAGRLLQVNPTIHCALISDLSPAKFHEVSEGLGLVAQIPGRPGKEDAEEILIKLRHIKGLMDGRSI